MTKCFLTKLDDIENDFLRLVICLRCIVYLSNKLCYDNWKYLVLSLKMYPNITGYLVTKKTKIYLQMLKLITFKKYLAMGWILFRPPRPPYPGWWAVL